jgi:hypothetical protein
LCVEFNTAEKRAIPGCAASSRGGSGGGGVLLVGSCRDLA